VPYLKGIRPPPTIAVDSNITSSNDTAVLDIMTISVTPIIRDIRRIV
jgi:hypothetical protein